MAKEIYRVGVVGSTGRGNYGHGIDTVWSDISQCEVVAVADESESGLAEAVERLGAGKPYRAWREMLAAEQPDIVAICPRWIDRHAEMAIAACESGALGIYMEKPFCRSLEEADAVIGACERSGTKLAVAHQTRYSPKLPVLRGMMNDGALGRIVEIRGHGKDDSRGGGEDLWVLGSHVMNLMHYFGGEPVWCSAQVEQDGVPVTADHVAEGNEGIGPLAGDHLRAMYGLSGGATGFFRSARNAAGSPSRFGITIYGSKGIIAMTFGYLPEAHWLDDPSWSPGRTGKEWIPISSAGPGEPEPIAEGSIHHGNIAAGRDLLDAIENDRHPECNMYEARTTISMIAAVFEAHRRGRQVTFPLENRRNPLAVMKDG